MSISLFWASLSRAQFAKATAAAATFLVCVSLMNAVDTQSNTCIEPQCKRARETRTGINIFIVNGQSRRYGKHIYACRQNGLFGAL